MSLIYICFVISVLFFFFFLKKNEYVHNLVNGDSQVAIYLCRILFMISLVIPYFLSFYGIDYTDTGYQLDMIMHSRYSDYPMSFGTILFGRPLLLFLPDNLLSARLLATMLEELTLFLPVITYCYLHKISVTNERLLVFSLLSSVLFFTSTTISFSYNLLTGFVLSLLMSFLLIYYKHSNIRVVVLLSLFTAVAISVRMPNIFISIVLLVLVFVRAVEEQQIKRFIIHVSVGTTLVVLVYLLLVVLIYGSLSSFYELLVSTVTSLSSSGESHSVIRMLGAKYRDLAHIVMLFSIVATYLLLQRCDGKRNIKIISTVLFCCCILLYLMLHIDPYLFSVKHYRSALSLVLISILFIKKNTYYSLLVLGFLLCPSIGSDTGLLKLGCFICMGLISIIMSDKYKMENVIIYMLIPAFLFIPFRLKFVTYEDAGVFNLHYETTEIPRLELVKTSEERVKSIDAVYKYIMDEKYINDNEIYIIGRYSYLFEYLCDFDNPLKRRWFLDLDNISDVESIIHQLEGSDKSVVLLLNDDRKTLMEDSLIASKISYKRFICK